MYSLLIVDDEPIIADGLFEMLCRQEHLDINVCKAYSGREALQFLKNRKVDILLTDIRMPEIDGLQLLDHVHCNWPICRVIFLTGYNEFDYVYKAIQYEGVSYILKTEGYEKIVYAVEKNIQEIEKGLRNEDIVRKSTQLMNNVLPILKKEYLQGLLQGKDDMPYANEEQLKELDITLNCNYPVILLIGCIENSGDRLTVSAKSQRLLSLKLIAENYFPQEITKADIIICENSTVVWLIQPKCPNSEVGDPGSADSCWGETELRVRRTLETIQAAVKESLNFTLTFVMSDNYVMWGEISQKFSYLKLLLNYRKILGNEVIIMEGSSPQFELVNSFRINSAAQQVKLKLKKLEMLETFLEFGQNDQFLNGLTSLLQDLKAAAGMNKNLIMEIFGTLSLFFMSYLNRWNLYDKISVITDIEPLNSMDRSNGWEENVSYFRCLIAAIFSLQSQENKRHMENAIQQVKQYINEHLGGDLSLGRLADIVYFNPKYLSRLFKQSTGSTLTEYINTMKINKAKVLLADNKKKICDVGVAIGYLSAPYFTRFFKKVTNMSPQEYRERYFNK